MKTYIIYLPGNELSTKLANQAIKSTMSIGVDAELFVGVNRDAAEQFFADNNIRLGPSDGATSWSPGTMGCFASHYSMWKLCCDIDQPVTVLEHDAIMLRNPTSILNQVVDVCHLDMFMPFNSGIPEDSEMHFKWYNEHVMLYQPGVTDYPSHAFYDTRSITGDCFRGAYGYIIKPSAAKRIINFVHEFGAFPADRAICSRVVKLQKSLCTYVRLNPFFKTLRSQRVFSTRM